MLGSPATRPSLLLRIRDSKDGMAWQEFVDLYTPLIYQHARKSGFQDADAADVSQEVLRAVAKAIARLRYDPGRGSFRGWLFTIVRNVQRNLHLHRKRHRVVTGQQEVIGEHPERDEAEETLWNLEYEKRLFAWAGVRVRADVQDATWQAFWQTAVQGRTFQQVAESLGMSIGAVYVAKSRVLERLRKEIQEFEER